MKRLAIACSVGAAGGVRSSAAERDRNTGVRGGLGLPGRAGVKMEMGPADPGFARVTLDEVKPVNGAKLLVRRAELDGCGADRAVNEIGRTGAGNKQRP